MAYAAYSLYRLSALMAQRFLFQVQAFCLVILRIYPRIPPILRRPTVRTIWTTNESVQSAYCLLWLRTALI